MPVLIFKVLIDYWYIVENIINTYLFYFLEKLRPGKKVVHAELGLELMLHLQGTFRILGQALQKLNILKLEIYIPEALLSWYPL